MIIAISGKIGSGKSTVGDIFEREGFVLDSFAKSVKDICCILFGYDRDTIEGSTPNSRIWREAIDKKNTNLLKRDFTPRDAMVLVGTEFGRNMIHNNIWIETLFNRYDKNKHLLVTDLRFPNEYEEIKKRGGIVIRINRPITTKLTNLNSSNHISECALDNHNFDYVINNDGTLYDLEISVLNIINEINEINENKNKNNNNNNNIVN
jgi:hypothetical protein